MIAHVRVKPPRGACLVLCLHPRLVRKTDERERQNDKHRHHAEQHYRHREQLAGPIVEGDLAVAQRGHGHHRPVEAVKPLVVLRPPLGFHEQAKCETRQQDKHQHDANEFQQLVDVPSTGRTVALRGQERGWQYLHRAKRAPVNRWEWKRKSRHCLRRNTEWMDDVFVFISTPGSLVRLAPECAPCAHPDPARRLSSARGNIHRNRPRHRSGCLGRDNPSVPARF